MRDLERAIDEYTLAAFLAGMLSEGRRREVIDHLAASPEAREVLQMASEALEAAHRGECSEPPSSSRNRMPPGPRPTAPRHPARRLRLRGSSLYVAALLIVVVIGLGLKLTSSTPALPLRSPPVRSGPELRVQVSAPGSSIAWSAVDDAYRYRLVVWDHRDAEVVGRYETPDHRLSADHPVVGDLERDLERGKSYTLRVDAIDAENRLLRSSDAIEFVFR